MDWFEAVVGEKGGSIDGGLSSCGVTRSAHGNRVFFFIFWVTPNHCPLLMIVWKQSCCELSGFFFIRYTIRTLETLKSITITESSGATTQSPSIPYGSLLSLSLSISLFVIARPMCVTFCHSRKSNRFSSFICE